MEEHNRSEDNNVNIPEEELAECKDEPESFEGTNDPSEVNENYDGGDETKNVEDPQTFNEEPQPIPYGENIGEGNEQHEQLPPEEYTGSEEYFQQDGEGIETQQTEQGEGGEEESQQQGTTTTTGNEPVATTTSSYSQHEVVVAPIVVPEEERLRLIEELQVLAKRREALRVTGLESGTSEVDVKKVFAPYGTFVVTFEGPKNDVALVWPMNEGEDIPTPESIEKAKTELHNSIVKGKRITVTDMPIESFLFVGNLPADMNNEELRRLFSSHGKLMRSFVMKRFDTGESKSYGFVEFSSRNEASAAKAAMSSFNIRGNALRVDWCDCKSLDQLHSATLFIDRLPKELSDPAQLKKLFGEFGTVRDAVVAKNAMNQLRGFAFVEFEKYEDAEKAKTANHNKKIGDSTLRVHFGNPAKTGQVGVDFRWAHTTMDHMVGRMHTGRRPLMNRGLVYGPNFGGSPMMRGGFRGPLPGVIAPLPFARGFTQMRPGGAVNLSYRRPNFPHPQPPQTSMGVRPGMNGGLGPRGIVPRPPLPKASPFHLPAGPGPLKQAPPGTLPLLPKQQGQQLGQQQPTGANQYQQGPRFPSPQLPKQTPYPQMPTPNSWKQQQQTPSQLSGPRPHSGLPGRNPSLPQPYPQKQHQQPYYPHQQPQPQPHQPLPPHQQSQHQSQYPHQPPTQPQPQYPPQQKYPGQHDPQHQPHPHQHAYPQPAPGGYPQHAYPQQHQQQQHPTPPPTAYPYPPYPQPQPTPTHTPAQPYPQHPAYAAPAQAYAQPAPVDPYAAYNQQATAQQTYTGYPAYGSSTGAVATPQYDQAATAYSDYYGAAHQAAEAGASRSVAEQWAAYYAQTGAYAAAAAAQAAPTVGPAITNQTQSYYERIAQTQTNKRPGAAMADPSKRPKY